MKWERLLTTVATAGLLGCSGDSSPSQPGDTGGSGPTVAVRNNLFDPATLQIPVNSTVTWQWNSGGVEHNVTFETGPSSGNQPRGHLFPGVVQSLMTHTGYKRPPGATRSG